MRPAFFDTPEYKKKQANLVHLNWQKGIYNFLIKKEERSCLNNYCVNHFTVPPSDKQRYCSRDCWFTVKRNYRIKTSPPCITCGTLVTQKGAFKYCSLKCQAKNNYNKYITRWKQGLENGTIGITTIFLSGYIKRYLREKYGERCVKCGWNERNPVTNKVPLEVNHVDGNSYNNREENLELLCPNCHALTPNFRNLNKGNGRKWRLDKIHSSISVNS